MINYKNKRKLKNNLLISAQTQLNKKKEIKII
jgi:hypothetical protein